MREVVPTARRMVAGAWATFREDAEALRPGLASGKYDAYVLLPRGVRDEEFHSAVLELLNDWSATVAVPEVVTVRIVVAGGRRAARSPCATTSSGSASRARLRTRLRGGARDPGRYAVSRTLGR